MDLVPHVAFAKVKPVIDGWWCWWMAWQSWACNKTTCSDQAPWDLKTNLCVATQRLLKPQSKVKTTNLSLYFGNFEISLLKGIFYFSFRAHRENNSWEISKIPFVRPLFFCLVKALLLFMSSLWGCHILPHQLFGETPLLMSVNLGRTCFSSWCFLPVYFQENPTVEDLLAFWSLLDH